MRKFFETIEIRIGKEHCYRDISHLLFKTWFKKESSIHLMKQLNLGFLCPDNEWRSKMCQFVYEELTTIFDFTEDLNKLHNFIKTASWNLPIALIT